MDVIRKTVRIVLWSLFVAIAHYELVAKSNLLLDQPLPGWLEADRAERSVAYRPVTGIVPMDRLLHEGREARVFYERLLR